MLSFLILEIKVILPFKCEYQCDGHGIDGHIHDNHKDTRNFSNDDERLYKSPY